MNLFRTKQIYICFKFHISFWISYFWGDFFSITGFELFNWQINESKRKTIPAVIISQTHLTIKRIYLP
jgi:hypothetical protein